MSKHCKICGRRPRVISPCLTCNRNVCYSEPGFGPSCAHSFDGYHICYDCWPYARISPWSHAFFCPSEQQPTVQYFAGMPVVSGVALKKRPVAIAKHPAAAGSVRADLDQAPSLAAGGPAMRPRWARGCLRPPPPRTRIRKKTGLRTASVADQQNPASDQQDSVSDHS